MHSTVRPAIFMYLNLCRNIIYHCECMQIKPSVSIHNSILYSRALKQELDRQEITYFKKYILEATGLPDRKVITRSQLLDDRELQLGKITHEHFTFDATVCFVIGRQCLLTQA